MSVRVRFAPSPTGFIHIGSIWQVLINYAFAKRFKGRFIVRIEDTDRARYVKGAEKDLFKALAWFGLEPDESPVHGGKYGPYKQSERLDLYQQYADQLLQSNHAYICQCTPERLKKLRQGQQKKGMPPMYDGKCRNLGLKKDELKKGSFVIRLKVPKNISIKVKDLLRGDIEFDSNTIDDQVLIKSDGYPTYHLAVVVDDYLMKITHMVRAEEWLPSAPKNHLIYEFLGWKKPVFVHTPTLRNPDRSKMSKRHGHTSVNYYQERFLKKAILNYLCLLGWSHPQEKELFSLDEFVKHFDLKDLSVASPVFDIQKLTYINGYYLRQKTDEELAQILKDRAGYLKIPQDWWSKIAPLAKDRIKDFSQESLDFWLKFYVGYKVYDIKELEKKEDKAKVQLKAINEDMEKIDEGKFKFESLQKQLLNLVDSKKDKGWKRAEFFQFLRIAITGRKVSLPLLESMEIMGKKKSLERIRKIIDKLQ
jgi:glutamyl-tRNA synthetase